MRIRRAAVMAVAGLAATAGVALVGSSPAGAGQEPQVTGVVSCDNTTGEQIITWTFEPFIQGDAVVNSTSLDSSALTAGSVTSGAVALSPTTVTAGGTATAQSVATIDAVGNVSLSVNWFNSPIETTLDSVGAVTLLGQCEAAPTTTTTTLPVDTTAVVETTAAVDTTVVATTAAPTTGLLGSGGTRIPRTGGDTTLAWLGAAFVAMGSVLLLVRRRSLAGR